MLAMCLALDQAWEYSKQTENGVGIDIYHTYIKKTNVTINIIRNNLFKVGTEERRNNFGFIDDEINKTTK